MKTLERFVNEAKKELVTQYEGGESEAVIRLLLEEVLGFSLSQLAAKKSQILEPEQEKRLINYINELKSGRPVQYVLGHAWFAGMKLRVNESVLIPRPETEELCEWIADGITDRKRELRVLDVGTGSGCISIAVKKKFPRAAIVGVDVSPAALDIARENAQANQAEVDFIEADILSRQFGMILPGPFDLIVSNPPYIRQSEKEQMHYRVTGFEPHLALFVSDEDPLVFYRAIVSYARKHLKTAGEMYFEINEALATAVADLLKEKEFDAEFKKDLSGKLRMVRAWHH